MSKKFAVLKKGELKKMLKKHAMWNANAKSTQLFRTFTFSNQIDALAFIARVTVHAQVLSHHPEIVFSFGKVKITVTTNDIKGLTKYDQELIEKIDALTTGG